MADDKTGLLLLGGIAVVVLLLINKQPTPSAPLRAPWTGQPIIYTPPGLTPWYSRGCRTC